MTELPFALVAELTHRCPLHCVYCSNPVELTAGELDTDGWMDVLDQAAELGVVQLQLTGGEPLVRDDAERLIARAVELGMYTHMVTSGIGLDRARIATLAGAGLHSLQLSFQADERVLADRIAGRKAHQAKLDALEGLAATDIVLGLNVVIHALNIDRLGSIVGLCRRFSPQRIELANAQYYGWALLNRASLLPTREQLARAERTYDELRARLAPALELVWVLPDYYERRPKPCMGGWARTSVTVAPDGTVLPCLAAHSIATLRFESVRDRPLAWIWHDSDAFNAFRGTGWMPEPCRSCEWREHDHGGCRCQAYLLTGDARRADPVCELSADHGLVEAALEHAGRPSVADGINDARTDRRLIHRRFRGAPSSTQLIAGDPRSSREV